MKYQFSDFATANTGGTFEEFIIPAADLVSSLWNKYIYRVYTGDSNNNTCKAMCAFDSDNIGTRNGNEIISFTQIMKTKKDCYYTVHSTITFCLHNTLVINYI